MWVRTTTTTTMRRQWESEDGRRRGGGVFNVSKILVLYIWVILGLVGLLQLLDCTALYSVKGGVKGPWGASHHVFLV